MRHFECGKDTVANGGVDTFCGRPLLRLAAVAELTLSAVVLVLSWQHAVDGLPLPSPLPSTNTTRTSTASATSSTSTSASTTKSNKSTLATTTISEGIFQQFTNNSTRQYMPASPYFNSTAPDSTMTTYDPIISQPSSYNNSTSNSTNDGNSTKPVTFSRLFQQLPTSASTPIDSDETHAVTLDLIWLPTSASTTTYSSNAKEVSTAEIDKDQRIQDTVKSWVTILVPVVCVVVGIFSGGCAIYIKCC